MNASKLFDILKRFLKALFDLLYRLVEMIVECLKDANRQEEYVAAQNRAYMAQQRERDFLIWVRPCYVRFANVVFDCLRSKHGECGFSRPQFVADVVITEKPGQPKRAEQDAQGSIIFRYKASRRGSDLYDGGLKKYEAPAVDLGRVKGIISDSLPNFAEMYGFGFAQISVYEDENGHIIIEIHGVYQFPPEVLI